MTRDEMIAKIPVLPEGWEFAEAIPRPVKETDEAFMDACIRDIIPAKYAGNKAKSEPRWILRSTEPDHDKMQRGEKLRALFYEKFSVYLELKDINEIEDIFAAHPMKGIDTPKSLEECDKVYPTESLVNYWHCRMPNGHSGMCESGYKDKESKPPADPGDKCAERLEVSQEGG